jgi:hypothetical protein
MARNERGNIGNPTQALPKMFRAMNANEYEFVFDSEGGDFARVELHANLSREEIFDGKPARKVAQREIVVQFDEQFRT